MLVQVRVGDEHMDPVPAAGGGEGDFPGFGAVGQHDHLARLGQYRLLREGLVSVRGGEPFLQGEPDRPHERPIQVQPVQ